MNKLILSAILALGLLTAWSCSKCFIENCPQDDLKLIQFYAKSDSVDLILSGRYELDSLKITPLLDNPNGVTPYYEITPTSPYIVAIEAGPNSLGYVFQLDTLPPDTLLTVVGFRKGTKCCDKGVNTFEKVILNGDTLPQGSNDFNIPLFK